MQIGMNEIYGSLTDMSLVSGYHLEICLADLQYVVQIFLRLLVYRYRFVITHTFFVATFEYWHDFCFFQFVGENPLLYAGIDYMSNGSANNWRR